MCHNRTSLVDLHTVNMASSPTRTLEIEAKEEENDEVCEIHTKALPTALPTT